MTDLDSFLASIDLHVKIRSANASTVDRIHQLCGKTNQFNLTLDRLSIDTVRDLAASGDSLFSAELVDRFGEYGLIGILHLREAEGALEMVNLLMSCRALGRRVENTLLAFARDRAEARGFHRLLARYNPGPHNGQMLDFLRSTGFHLEERQDGTWHGSLDLNDNPLPWPSHVQVEYPKVGEAVA